MQVVRDVDEGLSRARASTDYLKAVEKLVFHNRGSPLVHLIFVFSRLFGLGLHLT